jgi:hypothetical protein
MRVCDHVQCDGFPCRDLHHEPYWMPGLDEDPAAVLVILVSETAAQDPADGYEAPGDPLFARTTVEAFRDAGFAVSTLSDLRHQGVHLTTAVKCAKAGYTIDPTSVRTCSFYIEKQKRRMIAEDIAAAMRHAGIAPSPGLPAVTP